jgi:hypothetical protein
MRIRAHPFLMSESTYPFAGGMARTSLRLTKNSRAGHEVLVFLILSGLGLRLIKPQDQINVAVQPTMAWPGWRGLPHALRRARRLDPPPSGWREALNEAMAVHALDQAVLHFRPAIIHNHLPRRPFLGCWDPCRSACRWFSPTTTARQARRWKSTTASYSSRNSAR